LYSDIFPDTFQELETSKTIGTGREQNRLYELELISD